MFTTNMKDNNKEEKGKTWCCLIITSPRIAYYNAFRLFRTVLFVFLRVLRGQCFLAQQGEFGGEAGSIGLSPAALCQLGVMTRLLAAALALAQDLQSQGGPHAAWVVGERFQECLFGDGAFLSMQGRTAPGFHVVRAVAPGVVAIILLAFLGSLGEQAQSGIGPSPGAKEQPLGFPDPVFQRFIVFALGIGVS